MFRLSLLLAKTFIGFLIVLFCLATYREVIHPPLDHFALFEYTACFGIILFVSMLISTAPYGPRPWRKRSRLVFFQILLMFESDGTQR